MKEFKERFVNKFILEPNSGCWLWNAGYRIVKRNNKISLAHRASFDLYREKIPDGMIICHKRDNRSCVNLDHLFVGSYKDNTQYLILKGRKRVGDSLSIALIMRNNTNSAKLLKN